MKSRIGSIVIKIAAAVAAGVILRFAVDLRPVWWIVWLAPIPLLLIAFRIRPRDARWMVFLAAAIGTSCNYHYFRLVMPVPAVLAAITAQTLLWGFLIFATRRAVVRYRAWWTVFVYPVLWVAVDTLVAALLPDGNWGSLAYSQGDRLAILQVTSLLGTAGLLFLIALVPSALALAIAYGRSLRRGWIAYAITAALLGSSVLYGYLRLREPVRGVETTFGIVSIDDPIGLKASVSYAANILAEYDRRVEELAAQGAQVVVLPEKIAMITPAKAAEWQQRFSTLAEQNHVWIEVGVGIDDGKSPTNWAWLFAPDGTLAASYEKHHMAPPERRDNYSAGKNYTVQTVNGQSYGLAICKDMHFAALGRAYGVRHAVVMLVPAWDFDYLDGWIEARTTIVRGIENGYTIVRASREGLLTVSDPYGRILAEVPSSEMPGRSLLATTVVRAQVPTLYTRIGNLLGWLCVAAGAVFVAIGRGRARQRADLSTTS
ncbi:MAG: nitrilase-related carbon-nitrogen hydrolase [Terracidiphilus sp.]|jgi:apolipoprotein N-acyltransferase